MREIPDKHHPLRATCLNAGNDANSPADGPGRAGPGLRRANGGVISWLLVSVVHASDSVEVWCIMGVINVARVIRKPAPDLSTFASDRARGGFTYFGNTLTYLLIYLKL